jgi:hypothetical protein
MKKILLPFVCSLFYFSLFGQQAPPQGINYQAMVYAPISNQQAGVNVAGQLPANKQAIEVRFTIEEGNNGPIVYEEIHNDTTDQNGLLETIIGTGTPTSASPGTFNQIDWSQGDPYLRVSLILMESGTNISSYQKLWSVPYALYANKANSASYADSSGFAQIAGNGITGVTDNGDGTLTFTYYDGSTYTTGPLIGVGNLGAAQSWSLIGNAGTDPQTNFIGTTDATDWVIRTNSVERVRVKENGNIGIGILNPQYKLTTVDDGSGNVMPFGVVDLAGNPRFRMDLEGDQTVAFTNFKFDLYPLSANEQVQFRFFRGTNTAGQKSIEFFRGNNTTERSASIGVDGLNSYFQNHGGNLGIGTNAPSEKLELNNGGIRINGFYGVGFNDQPFGNNTPNGNEGAKIYFDNTITLDPNKDYLVFEKKDGNGVNPDGGIVFTNRGNNGVRTPSMIVDGFGRVGIGTITPARTLHVNSVMRLEPIPSAPSSPAKGDMYFDSTLNKLRVFDGTIWQNCW